MIIYDADITGSLKVNGSDFNLSSISSSIVTNSSSIASLESVSGSYANSASFASDISTNSASIASLETVSGSYANSASFASDISTNSSSIASLEIVSGSYANSSSFASDISTNSSSIGSLNAVSSSYLLNTTDTLTGDLTVTGNIIATTLNVQDVTASVIYSSGSNIFGSSSIDTQQFTGSILTSGSIEVNGDKFTVSGATGNTVVGGTLNSGAITSTGNSTFAGNVLINKASNPTYLQIGSSLTDDPFIIFQTDGNTMSMGIDRSDSNVFKISDNSTLGDARLVISNAGNVAINYTAPDGYGTLTVNGTSALPILALRSESGKVRQGFFEGGAGRFFLDTLNGSSGLSFVDGSTNTEKMRIDSSGGVSITPTTSTSFFYGADGTNSYINFETNNIDATVQLYAGYSSGGYFAVGTKDSGGTLAERMRIDSSGNVGIGIDDPLSKLHISGQSGTTGLPSLLLYGESPATGQRYGFNVSADQLDISALGTNAGIGFYTGGNASSITQRMVIDNSGNSTFTGNVSLTSGALSITSDGSNAVTFTESSNGLLTIAAPDDIILDCGSDIVLDANGADIRFKDNGLEFGRISKGGGSDLVIESSIADKDIFFSGTDGTTGITALLLDMSNGGSATFNDDIDFGGKLTQTGTGDNTFGGNVIINKSSGKIDFRNGSGSSRYFLEFANSNNDLQINDRTGVGAVAMTIQSGGNVGIGTDSPQVKLQTNLTIVGSLLAYLNGTSATFDAQSNIAVVHNSPSIGSATAAGLVLANNDKSNGAPSPIIAFSAKSESNSFNHTYAAIYGIKTATGADSNWNEGDLVFATSDGTGPKERMRITNGGDVLISKQSSDFVTAGIELRDTGQINTSVNADNFNFYNPTAGVYRFFVSAAGAVYATSTSINAISDITLKENIKPLETGLNEVIKLQPRRFDWKNGDGKNIAGFVAQEVEEILPDLVSDYKYNDEETKKAIKMGDMIPTLVKAIQELKADNDSLKAEIEILKNK